MKAGGQARLDRSTRVTSTDAARGAPGWSPRPSSAVQDAPSVTDSQHGGSNDVGTSSKTVVRNHESPIRSVRTHPACFGASMLAPGHELPRPPDSGPPGFARDDANGDRDVGSGVFRAHSGRYVSRGDRLDDRAALAGVSIAGSALGCRRRSPRPLGRIPLTDHADGVGRLARGDAPSRAFDRLVPAGRH